MAKPTNTLITDTLTTDALTTGASAEDVGQPVISDIAVPDVSSLGWPLADQVFLHVESQQNVGEFHTPGSQGVEDFSAFEFTIADLPADSLLADIENTDLGFFDLNDLLVHDDSVPEGHMLQVSDASAAESTGSETAFETESSLSDVNSLSVNMAFPQLTIVIDDESDPNTVAI